MLLFFKLNVEWDKHNSIKSSFFLKFLIKLFKHPEFDKKLINEYVIANHNTVFQNNALVGID